MSHSNKRIICNKILGKCGEVIWKKGEKKPSFWDDSYDTMDECKEKCHGILKIPGFKKLIKKYESPYEKVCEKLTNYGEKCYPPKKFKNKETGQIISTNNYCLNPEIVDRWLTPELKDRIFDRNAGKAIWGNKVHLSTWNGLEGFAWAAAHANNLDLVKEILRRSKKINYEYIVIEIKASLVAGAIMGHRNKLFKYLIEDEHIDPTIDYNQEHPNKATLFLDSIKSGNMEVFRYYVEILGTKQEQTVRGIDYINRNAVLSTAIYYGRNRILAYILLHKTSNELTEVTDDLIDFAIIDDQIYIFRCIFDNIEKYKKNIKLYFKNAIKVKAIKIINYLYSIDSTLKVSPEEIIFILINNYENFDINKGLMPIIYKHMTTEDLRKFITALNRYVVGNVFGQEKIQKEKKDILESAQKHLKSRKK